LKQNIKEKNPKSSMTQCEAEAINDDNTKKTTAKEANVYKTLPSIFRVPNVFVFIVYK